MCSPKKHKYLSTNRVFQRLQWIFRTSSGNPIFQGIFIFLKGRKNKVVKLALVIYERMSLTIIQIHGSSGRALFPT
jgi:hypothetical protein